MLQHIRSLRCEITDGLNPPDGLDFLRDYSPSLCQLGRLKLSSGRLPYPAHIGTYPAFQHTLLYLSLSYCRVTASGIVTLVNYFPNLAHLDLCALPRMPDDQPTPPFSRPLQKLSVDEFHGNGGLGLIDRLVGTHPQCDQVTIRMDSYSCPSLSQHVIDGVYASVTRLNLKCELRRASNN